MSITQKSILIDGRELVPQGMTGIGRVLIGLLDALAETDIAHAILLVVTSKRTVPEHLKRKSTICIRRIPPLFITSELQLSRLTRSSIHLFVSPYPKLPLFGVGCPAIHTVHDVLYLTHPVYKSNHFRTVLDKLRLKSALRRSDLTWYDSMASQKETEKLVGRVGKKAKVRYPGLSDTFNIVPEQISDTAPSRYNLSPGYILSTGNGLPHKNLGVLLEISTEVDRDIVFVGVRPENRIHWEKRYPDAKARWIERVADEDMPAIVKNAFCLAQPSTAEGYGYPPLEAMACGVPAVVSDIPVLVETTGGHALTALPNQPRKWIEAVRSLENQHIRQGLIEEGLKWVAPFKGVKAWNGHLADIVQLVAPGCGQGRGKHDHK